MSKFTLGTDPELMLVQNGAVVSAIEPLNERDKYNKISDKESGTAFYCDNVLLEGNVEPSSSPDQFVSNLRGLFSHFHKQFPDYSLVAQASHTFSEKECSHLKAKQFGCEPEFDVDARAEVRPPTPESAKNFRSAGGHIHIGMLESKWLEDLENKVYGVQLMDLYVGIPMVLMDNDPTSPDRKVLYGKAGRFRFTPYGIEYRTPSNFWTSTPELSALVAELTLWVMEQADSGRAEELVGAFDRAAVVDCINNHSKFTALEIVNNIPLPEELLGRIIAASEQEHKANVIENWKL